MRSLFILSLPRSLSTDTFRGARDALGLKAPHWVTNGEILNHDLYALSTWPKLSESSRKFLIRERVMQSPLISSATAAPPDCGQNLQGGTADRTGGAALVDQMNY
jgi:hypothetical protein